MVVVGAAFVLTLVLVADPCTDLAKGLAADALVCAAAADGDRGVVPALGGDTSGLLELDDNSHTD